MATFWFYILLALVNSNNVFAKSPAVTFDHSGSRSRPHAISGIIITTVQKQQLSARLSAHAVLTHCFPAQPHDGLYLTRSSTWLHESNFSSAFEICGSALVTQTDASIGIMQVSLSCPEAQQYASMRPVVTSGPHQHCGDCQPHDSEMGDLLMC